VFHDQFGLGRSFAGGTVANEFGEGFVNEGGPPFQLEVLAVVLRAAGGDAVRETIGRDAYEAQAIVGWVECLPEGRILGGGFGRER